MPRPPLPPQDFGHYFQMLCGLNNTYLLQIKYEHLGALYFQTILKVLSRAPLQHIYIWHASPSSELS